MTGGARAVRAAAAPDLLGPLYLDASALAKLYLPETGSDALNRVLEGRSDLVVSDLAVTEIVSSVCRRRREGAVTDATVALLRRAVLAHLDEGLYRKAELFSTTHREAEGLLVSLAPVPLRAADALHLALAKEAGAATVLTYDRRLAEAASASGLRVFPV